MKCPDVLRHWSFSVRACFQASVPFDVQQLLNLIVGGIIFVHGLIILDCRWRHLDGRELRLPMRLLSSKSCQSWILLLWRQSRQPQPYNYSLQLHQGHETLTPRDYAGGSGYGLRQAGLPSPTSHSCRRRRALRVEVAPKTASEAFHYYMVNGPAGLRTPTWMRRLQHNILMRKKKKKPCRRRRWACEATTEARAAQLCCAFIRGASPSRLVFVPH